MLGEQFYPTPKSVIEEMVDGLDLHHKRVLDPSAGRGDILEYILEETLYDRYYGRQHSSELYAIEIDSSLRAILTEKGFKVIDSDFLAYPGDDYFDLILMNPPFGEGARHLLKAWKISHGAIIKCLLNTETLRNTYTQDRKELTHIIERFGNVKELGAVFRDAERKTDAEVVLVTLQNPEVETFRIDFDPEVMGANDYGLGELTENAIASANIFENYEARYGAAIEAFKELLAARQKVKFYMNGLTSRYRSSDDIISEALKEGKGPDISYIKFKDDFTKYAWDLLYSETPHG